MEASKKPWKLIFVRSNGAMVVFAIAPAMAPEVSDGKTDVIALEENGEGWGVICWNFSYIDFSENLENNLPPVLPE